MKSVEASPAYGQIWKHKKNGREAYVMGVGFARVIFRYSDSRRTCGRNIVDFKKQFYFSHVDA